MIYFSIDFRNSLNLVLMNSSEFKDEWPFRTQTETPYTVARVLPRHNRA